MRLTVVPLLRSAGPVILLFTFAALRAAVWHVDPHGDDTNAGTEDAPWGTIQKSASAAQPGDVVVVHRGVYPERVSTVRGGSGPNSRITFRALGHVEMRGWVVHHAYITVEGFQITGHATSSKTDAYVRVDRGGDFFELLGCTIRDGIGTKRNDILFVPPNEIHSSSGGFAAAGFRPGQIILVARGTNTPVLNAGEYALAEVTDSVLVLTNRTIVAEGPKPVYITASASFGLITWGTTDGCVIRSNRFSNLSYDACFVQGRNHRIEYNLFENNNGWDFLYFAGTNHVFQGNWFRNGGWGVYDPSPDILDNWPVRYENVYFMSNFVHNVFGVVSAQKRNQTSSGPLFIRHNVFIDVGWLTVVMPYTSIEHNTFLRVARQSNVLVQRATHPITIEAANYATNAVIRNNVFVDCGEPSPLLPLEKVGWYAIVGPSESIVVGGNFVAGPPPAYGAKIGFLETPSLNGGDPGFVNIDDPLGPDGLPFTEDDGLRLRPDSKLLHAGVGGATIGAYELPYTERMELVVFREGSDSIRIQWPRAAWEWRLESGWSPSGPWSAWPGEPELRDGLWEVTVAAKGAALFFRLRR